MKRIFLSTILLIGSLLYANAQQIIQSTGPITLPQSGQPSFTMPANTNVLCVSGTSVTLLPGVTIQVQSGYTFEAKISTSAIDPAPVNPASDDNLNWIVNRVFDANGNVIGESKSFFDDSGKPLQSQWKDISRGHVLAAQSIYDALQRPVISTLAAPINNGAFAYKANFVQNTLGGIYDYKNFDENSKLNNPDGVGAASIGTLGWYYSANNSFEKYVPETNYPYSRYDFYNDGSGEARRSSDVGEQLRMGGGHEPQSISLSVLNELDHYIAVRNKFFIIDSIGSQSTSLKEHTFQKVGIDQNGQKGIAILDESGKILMSARNGSLHSVQNTLKINSFDYNYSLNPFLQSGGAGGFVENISLQGDGNLKVYKGSTLLFTGLMRDYIPPTSLGGGPSDGLVFKSNEPFTVSYKGYFMSSCKSCSGQLINTDPKAASFHYFSLLAATTLSITGDYELRNLITDEVVSGNALNAGIYKIRSINDSEVVLSYTNSFEDISYNFYNQLGQLVATIAPEGVKQLLQTNFNNITKKEDIPFSTFYNYDAQGRLIKAKVFEGGTTEYAYRKDGSIRFSQNSLQVANNSFSYTNYDQYGRAIESGEYVTGSNGTKFNDARTSSIILEDVTTGGLSANGIKRDWIQTYYDVAPTTASPAVSDLAVVAPNYMQDFTIGGVAYTRKANSESNIVSETWYSYDEKGRLTWRVQNITGLGAKTIDYIYDFNGNVQQAIYQKGAAGQFYHFYEYDADQRLSAVYTSKDDIVSNKVLEAKYYYYLHGPLKRVELAGDLQGVDYTYTPQGWLKTINHPSKIDANDPGKDGTGNSFAKDVFGMSLEYFNGDYNRTGSNISSISTGTTLRYNGNIAGSSWKSQKLDVSSPVVGPNMMVYEYDNKYQLTESTFGKPDFNLKNFTADPTNKFKETFSYRDSHGNLDILTRKSDAGATVDNFKYNYFNSNISNRLQNVEKINNPGTYYSKYTYDILGQMLKQTKDGIDWFVKYDVTGKVTGVYTDENCTVKKVTYTYDENGQRVAKRDYVLNKSTFYVNDPSGNILAIYEATGTDSPTNIVLKETPIYGADRLGTYYYADNNRVYELKDQLGNVRAVLKRNKVGGQLELQSYGDYYAYGSDAQRDGDYRYDYQGQYAEKDKETEWNAFELRMYDARIARWLSVDPYGQYWSPYIGMGNNPINGVDPDGGANEGWIKTIDGGYSYDSDVHSDADIIKYYGEGFGSFAGETASELRNSGAAFFQGNANGTFKAYGIPVYKQLKQVEFCLSTNLASLIIESDRVSFASIHVSPLRGFSNDDLANAIDNIIDAANERPALTSPYSHVGEQEVLLKQKLLQGMLDLSEKYTYSVSEITGGRHSDLSRHYIGVAIDITKINGIAVSAHNKYYKEFMQYAKTLGATEVLGPGKKNHGSHVHLGWPRNSK